MAVLVIKDSIGTYPPRPTVSSGKCSSFLAVGTNHLRIISARSDAQQEALGDGEYPEEDVVRGSLATHVVEANHCYQAYYDGQDGHQPGNLNFIFARRLRSQRLMGQSLCGNILY